MEITFVSFRVFYASYHFQQAYRILFSRVMHMILDDHDVFYGLVDCEFQIVAFCRVFLYSKFT